ncbi:ferric-chelate reductase (NADH) [Ranunculus cassubicifolius]
MKMTSYLQTVFKVLMLLSFASWICLWILKPTELWTKAWKKAENSARDTVFGYQGLDFVVYTLPLITVAVTGFMYLHLHSKEQRSREKRVPVTHLSNPIIVRSPLGIISGRELLAAILFIIFLGWTIYAHITKDFKKLTPAKLLKMEAWQYKFQKFGTRFGLLAEVCIALLLLPILRGMSIFRIIGVQFEASIRYHVFFGTTMILFATLHGLITIFIWGVKHQLEEKMWKWQETGRVYLAGEIALVIGLVIWVTSLPQIRRKNFELFYYTHHLYALFLVFFLFHVGDRHFYMVLSGVLLFGVDRLLRIVQSRPETCLLSARLFPCDAIELTLAKHPRLMYTPTSVIFLKVPTISKFQWHPFSITSSSNVDNDKLTIIVKSEGDWTNSLHNIVLAAIESSDNQAKCLPLSVEGPYGPVSTDFLRYDSLLLVAGGIGLTPFLSIIQEIGSAQNSKKIRLPTNIQLIYATKKSQGISLLNPISHLIRNQSVNHLNLKVSIFVTQEEKSIITAKELRTEMPRVQTVNFVTEYRNYAVSGLGNLQCMAVVSGLSAIIFLLALVCLNHTFLHPENMSSEKKNPSWVIDILLISSLVVAAICSSLVLAIITWRKAKKDNPPVHQKQSKDTELGYLEASSILEGHEIRYGERPNFEDIFSKFPGQAGGFDVGVLVCGPESMKESVALSCKQHSQGSIIGARKKKPCFNFHSLSFSL